MRTFRRLDQAGDTIVEVLIVLAVLSLAFSISAATANRGLTQSHNAQEHSQGLGTLDSQIEQLRSAIGAAPTAAQTVPFCMLSTTTSDTNFGTGYDPAASAATDDFTKYPADCTLASGGLTFYKSVVYVCDAACVADGGTTGYYSLRVRWDGQGSLGRQEESMTYKIQPLTPTATSGIPVTGSQAQVVVKVLEIPPRAGNTQPACTDASAAGHHTGTTITLNGAGQVDSTDSGGTVTFTNNVHDYSSYTATISNLPSGWSLCGSSTSGTVTPVGNVKEIDFVIIPSCTVVHGTGPAYAHYGVPYAHYTGAYAHYGAPYEHYHLAYSSSTWWWHTSGQDAPYRDWGPNGYGPGFSETGYTSWEQQIGISGANDYAATINGSTMYGQYGSGWNIDPSPWFAGTSATGSTWYQDHDHGNGIANNKKWYNWWQQVVTNTPYWVDDGYWADYTGTWADYLGTYGDYLGTYGDPTSTPTCSP